MANDILIVDDEADIRSLVAGLLHDEGYTTREAKDGKSALAAIESRRPGLVILDIWLEGSELDGIEILKVIKRDHRDLPVVMISGHGNIEVAVSAIRLGAYDFIEKPFEADRLLLVLQRAIEASRLKRENEELRLRAGGDVRLTGKSSAIQAVRAAVDRVSPTGSRVLITGPAGSGKEVVARLIHAQSRRASGPFIVLNAAAMAPDRVESELFGMETGATGPQSPRKIGTFEQAHGGTLFLDEVADMPLETQGKILRVLQDQAFHRVGGHIRVEVDVRVIAATSRDLLGEIAAKRFREDLFYRLNVVPIRVPALRERREDIPLLVEHFLEISSRAAGLPRRHLAPDAMAVLETADWPGNVRQLRNIIDWILIMATGDGGTEVTAEMLPPEVAMGAAGAVHYENGAEVMSLPLREARELFERRYLQAQVSRFGGNISRTASFVGMERSALHRKLKSLGITGDERV
ncbi:MAG: sigma-54-dependent Fis family transcriptional regulator [Rhodospirillaceae bacterium]|nr:sigma-54-dependent Fis family transcriptional regulator [Rhodospirillaceae bacterium]